MRSPDYTELIALISERLVPYDDTLTTREIAIVLNKHPQTIRRYIAQGKLKGLLNGREYLSAKKWIMEFLESHGEIILDSGYNFKLKQQKRLLDVVDFCSEPRTYLELLTFTSIKTKEHLQRTITRPLMKMGLLTLLYPEVPHSNHQKYVSIERRMHHEARRFDIL